jgi:hypothetical protein
MRGEADRPVAANGTALSVLYAVGSDGASPAKEFVELQEIKDQRKLAVLFQRMADVGELRNREKFKKVEGDIWEFKSHQLRILCFRDGPNWILTNGFLKKKDQIPPSELDRAQRIMSEDSRRRTQRR